MEESVIKHLNIILGLEGILEKMLNQEAVFFLVSGADTMGRLAYYGMEAAGGRAIVNYFWTINGKEPITSDVWLRGHELAGHQDGVLIDL
ncbi:hypothetical protein EYF80_056706 [Liparis tanakae]|uniref:Uncharacterized protein n=1 Tax=Liparis tanakae TaxID=230148 RepID=A0A4Z2EX25_9TELE|nr:hypothetical protein EYF80_056706 [Liparis tanakae]